jgi:hypothetical protein
VTRHHETIPVEAVARVVETARRAAVRIMGAVDGLHDLDLATVRPVVIR